MKALVKNLRTNDSERIMFCPICQAEYSANKSDYFGASDTDKFKCCGLTMDIVTKHTVYCGVN